MTINAQIVALVLKDGTEDTTINVCTERIRFLDLKNLPLLRFVGEAIGVIGEAVEEIQRLLNKTNNPVKLLLIMLSNKNNLNLHTSLSLIKRLYNQLQQYLQMLPLSLL